MTAYRPRFRLTDFLTGTDYEAIPAGPGVFNVIVPGFGHMLVPGSLLVEAPPPPLPPEPELRAVVLDGEGWAWQRTENGWMPGGGAPRAWAEVCQFGTPTRLVPDPFAEPVTLPWDGDTTYGAKVGARDLDTGSVNDWIQRDKDLVVATLTPALARDKARALWAAADAAEVQR